jgi:NAD(P)-dependent dehydrogenase (short-subunit alcohol dehydrogenase family)
LTALGIKGKPDGKVAVVAGATRGAGRGIACMLGEAGATVYCTGRSIRGQPSSMGRPETIEETAEMVTAYGGTGIWVQVDHTQPDQVKALFERVSREQGGRLDVLVNDIWGGDPLTEWGKPFWKHSLENGLLMQRRAVHTHIITSHYGVPLMVARRQGLVIEITDGDSYDLRGNLYYDLAKISAIRLAQSMARELRQYKVSAIALTPGYLRSEAMLDGFGVTEANWRDATKRDPFFAASETPFYIGRAVVALASDPDVLEKTGQPLHVGNLAREYGLTDVDGRQPHCPQHFAEIRKRLRRFDVSDLRDIARELGIEGHSRMSKGELFGTIEWADPKRLE